MKETEEQHLNKPSPSRSPSIQATELENQTKRTKKPLYKRTWFLVTTAVILLLLIVIIILIFTVFKVRDPTITLSSTELSGVAPRVNLPALRVELNITLDLKLAIRNRNYVSLKYGRGDAVVTYEGDQVGYVDIEPGEMGSRSTGTIKCRLTLEADKFNMTSLIADVGNGTMSFDVRSTLAGRAKILGFIKKHVKAVSTCQLDIAVSSLEVLNQVCKTKTKL